MIGCARAWPAPPVSGSRTRPIRSRFTFAPLAINVTALRAIDAAVSDLPGARRIGGKLVVNLVPEGAPTKGAALECARRLLTCDTALYVGDDETDEEVFGAMRAGRLLSVRVGPAEESRASFRLERQSQIDGLLRQLIALRAHRIIDPLDRRYEIRV